MFITEAALLEHNPHLGINTTDDTNVIYSDINSIYNDISLIYNDISLIYNDINVLYNDINVIYNKTGTRQCTRSIFADIDSTQCIDALFRVTGISGYL